eukprot:15451082-Alexandrium_andersonii.AAC.1
MQLISNTSVFGLLATPAYNCLRALTSSEPASVHAVQISKKRSALTGVALGADCGKGKTASEVKTSGRALGPSRGPFSMAGNLSDGSLRPREPN